MRGLTVLKALGPIDARSVQRDSLLAWLVAMPLVVGLLVRWGAPAVAAWLVRDFGFDLTRYYTLLMSYFIVLQVPMITGLVIGFLMIEERDDRTLTALLVTPLPLGDYLRYRIGWPLLLGAALTGVSFWIAGLVTLPWGWLLAIVGLAALEAPLMSLFLFGFAADKVQAFAFVKGVGAVLLAPVAAWFVPEPWQLLAGLVPSYWPIKAFWLVSEARTGGALLVLAAGLVVHLSLLWALLHRFRTVLHHAPGGTFLSPGKAKRSRVLGRVEPDVSRAKFWQERRWVRVRRAGAGLGKPSRWAGRFPRPKL